MYISQCIDRCTVLFSGLIYDNVHPHMLFEPEANVNQDKGGLKHNHLNEFLLEMGFLVSSGEVRT